MYLTLKYWQPNFWLTCDHLTELFWRHLFLRKPICCSHLLDQWIITHFARIVTCSFEIFGWSNTFGELLWSTWLMWRTSADLWKFLHPLVNAFFFPAFVQSLQIIDKSSSEPLVCSHPNSFSHLSKKLIMSSPLFTVHSYSGHLTDQTTNKHGRELIQVSRMCKSSPVPFV